MKRPIRTAALLAVAAIAAAPQARATIIADAAADFLNTYAGPQNGDLDILTASATFDGTNFRLGSTLNGTVGSSIGSLFVFGINRGGGTERLMLAAPPIGTGIFFDSVAVLFPDGTGRIATFPAMGPPTITTLPGAVIANGDSISGLFPLSLLPSRGFSAQDYTFSLWSRRRVNPAMDGTNAEIADFAPDASGFRATAVPEPESWGLMIVGFAALGCALRRRRGLQLAPGSNASKWRTCGSFSMRKSASKS